MTMCMPALGFVLVDPIICTVLLVNRKKIYYSWYVWLNSEQSIYNFSMQKIHNNTLVLSFVVTNCRNSGFELEPAVWKFSLLVSKLYNFSSIYTTTG